MAAVKRVGKELACQVADKNRRNSHHHARIEPVIEVTGPTDDELRDARELIGIGLGQERLLGEEVGGAGAGIQFREFGVGDGGGKAEQQRGDDAEPDRRARHRGPILGLLGERQPQECPGGNQGHGVHGQAGQAQRFLHLRWFEKPSEYLAFPRVDGITDSSGPAGDQQGDGAGSRHSRATRAPERVPSETPASTGIDEEDCWQMPCHVSLLMARSLPKTPTAASYVCRRE